VHIERSGNDVVKLANELPSPMRTGLHPPNPSPRLRRTKRRRRNQSRKKRRKTRLKQKRRRKKRKRSPKRRRRKRKRKRPTERLKLETSGKQTRRPTLLPKTSPARSKPKTMKPKSRKPATALQPPPMAKMKRKSLVGRRLMAPRLLPKGKRKLQPLVALKGGPEVKVLLKLHVCYED